jgi:hypothetical protein
LASTAGVDDVTATRGAGGVCARAGKGVWALDVRGADPFDEVSCAARSARRLPASMAMRESPARANISVRRIPYL